MIAYKTTNFETVAKLETAAIVVSLLGKLERMVRMKQFSIISNTLRRKGNKIIKLNRLPSPAFPIRKVITKDRSSMKIIIKIKSIIKNLE
ncbi:MAG: hypothetical protein N2645_12750 [Clostridia bacterium]|nr:hypothetical protein [Clostridia bacterium]